jgi:hypothetical protein
VIVATVPVNAVSGAVTGGAAVVVGASVVVVVVVVVAGAGAVDVAARVVDVVDDLGCRAAFAVPDDPHAPVSSVKAANAHATR